MAGRRGRAGIASAQAADGRGRCDAVWNVGRAAIVVAPQRDPL